MKKTLLLYAALFTASLGHAQVATFVLQPPSLEGALEFSWAQGWGQTPDLNDPANTVTGTAVFVDDGTAADSLGCNALVNGAAIATKIAVVYRGDCEFGMKSMNAQNQGAIAIVIINNVPGSPIAMGGGAVGGNVTIPVVMITDVDGARLKSEIIAGNVVLRIGTVLGLFPNNLSITGSTMDISRVSALPAPIAASAAEFSMPLGGFVNNFGSANQTGVVLNATVKRNGVEVYNQNSTPGSIVAGGSAFLSLPTFTQPSYSGYYEITYTVNGPNPDDFPIDNNYAFNFLADEVFACATIDETTRLPRPSGHYRPTGDQPNFMTCVHFRDPNASRLKATGVYASASKAGGASMDGEVLEARAYRWNDSFTGIANATFDALQTLDVADYFYDQNLSGQVIYIPFNRELTLLNNQRYLFCVFSPANNVFLGHDVTRDYTRVLNTYDDPLFPNNNGAQWFSGGFGPTTGSAVGVKMLDVLSGIDERTRLEVTPYPNPASAFIQIPLAGQTGAATLEVFDLSGAKVAERRVSVGGDNLLTVDVNDIANGTYVFHMNFENGKQASFRVVVTK